ncbi:transposase [Streptomyces sp. NBRC 14336]|uniref:transposase n=1 Tax=Streptomyces sp. NBRC 14336 TaxID=3030992 RepID=UPI00331D96EB
MSDAEWAVVRDAMPVPPWLEGRGGQPEGYCHRQIFDAIRYLVAGGITWRAVPADFPVWDRVYAFARRWGAKGLLAELHDRLRGLVREDAGHDPEPTAAIVDSQSVRAAATVPASSRGSGTSSPRLRRRGAPPARRGSSGSPPRARPPTKRAATPGRPNPPGQQATRAPPRAPRGRGPPPAPTTPRQPSRPRRSRSARTGPRPPAAGQSPTPASPSPPPRARPAPGRLPPAVPPRVPARPAPAPPATPRPTPSRHLHRRDNPTARACLANPGIMPELRKRTRQVRYDNGF